MAQNFSYPSTVSANIKTVISEIEWGLRYKQRLRDEKKKQEEEKHCPIVLSKQRSPNPCKKFDELFALLKTDGKKMYADPFLTIRREALREKREEKVRKELCGSCCQKPLIVDRDTLTHQQHLNLLATPREIPSDKKKKKRKKKKNKKCTCKKAKNVKKEPTEGKMLSPRMKQLSLPLKRLIQATWCRYGKTLGPECVERMEALLLARNNPRNLDDYQATQYFKEQRKKKSQAKKSKNRKKAEERKKCERKAINNEINLLADLIVHRAAAEPLEAQNNKHLQLGKHLIEILRYKGYKIKQINRNTQNYREQVRLKIIDHVCVWSDQVVQEAEEKNIEYNIRKFEEMLERQREEKRRIKREREAREMAREAEEKKKSKHASLETFDELKYQKDREVIETLIALLEGNKSLNLDLPIRHKALKNVTYKQLLEKLRCMRDDKVQLPALDSSHHSLKNELVKWTMKNRPEQLSHEVKKAIEIVSKCLLKIIVKPKVEVDEGKKSLESIDIAPYRDPNENMEEEAGEGMDEGSVYERIYI